MAVGKECLGLAENFEEMKRWAYRKYTIKPPPGGIFISSPFEGGLIWEGAGSLVNLETTMVSVFHKKKKKLEYKVEKLKYKKFKVMEKNQIRLSNW